VLDREAGANSALLARWMIYPDSTGSFAFSQPEIPAGIT
jgi:hypothetical protein